MARLSAARIAQLQARIVTLTAQATAADAAYEEALSVGVEDYRVDTGDGSERVKRRKLKELLDNSSELWREIERLQNILDCKGITRLSLRRKPVGYYA
jgi:hypothetical protein